VIDSAISFSVAAEVRDCVELVREVGALFGTVTGGGGFSAPLVKATCNMDWPGVSFLRD
jgi:hypothetical protein